MPGHVSEGKCHATARKPDDVVKIAADLRRREAVGRDVEARRPGLRARQQIALHLSSEIGLGFELLAAHIRPEPDRDQRHRDQQRESGRCADGRVSDQPGERRRQAVAVERHLQQQPARPGGLPARRQVTRQSAPTRKHANENLTAVVPVARKRGIPVTQEAPPVIRPEPRARLAARGDERAVALQERQGHDLVTGVGAQVVENRLERGDVLGARQARRPFDVPHTLLAGPARLLANDIARHVLIGDDRLREQGDGQQRARHEEPADPETRNPVREGHNAAFRSNRLTSRIDNRMR